MTLAQIMAVVALLTAFNVPQAEINNVQAILMAPQTTIPGEHTYLTYPDNFKPNVAGGIGSVDIPATSTPNIPYTLEDAKVDQAKDIDYQKCISAHPQTFGGCYISNPVNNFLPQN